MRKTRKIVTSILCSMLLIASTITATAASPYAVVIPCPQCRVGNITQTTSRTHSGYDTKPCTHGVGTNDYVECFDITVREYCDNCSYGTTNSYKEYVYLWCLAD